MLIKHKPESCSYLIEKVVSGNGSDKFMNADFFGIEEIAKFAKAIQKYIKEMEKEKKPVINLDELKPMEKPYKMYKTLQPKEEIKKNSSDK